MSEPSDTTASTEPALDLERLREVIHRGEYGEHVNVFDRSTCWRLLDTIDRLTAERDAAIAELQVAKENDKAITDEALRFVAERDAALQRLDILERDQAIREPYCKHLEAVNARLEAELDAALEALATAKAETWEAAATVAWGLTPLRNESADERTQRTVSAIRTAAEKAKVVQS